MSDEREAAIVAELASRQNEEKNIASAIFSALTDPVPSQSNWHPDPVAAHVVGTKREMDAEDEAVVKPSRGDS